MGPVPEDVHEGTREDEEPWEHAEHVDAVLEEQNECGCREEPRERDSGRPPPERLAGTCHLVPPAPREMRDKATTGSRIQRCSAYLSGA